MVSCMKLLVLVCVNHVQPNQLVLETSAFLRHTSGQSSCVQVSDVALCPGPVRQADLAECSLLLLGHLQQTAPPTDGRPAARPHSASCMVQDLTAFCSWQRASPLGRPCWLQTSTLQNIFQKALLRGWQRLQQAFYPLFCVHGLKCMTSGGFRHMRTEVHDPRTKVCFLLLCISEQ